jgi:hypothetical protein
MSLFKKTSTPFVSAIGVVLQSSIEPIFTVEERAEAIKQIRIAMITGKIGDRMLDNEHFVVMLDNIRVDESDDELRFTNRMIFQNAIYDKLGLTYEKPANKQELLEKYYVLRPSFRDVLEPLPLSDEVVEEQIDEVIEEEIFDAEPINAVEDESVVETVVGVTVDDNFSYEKHWDVVKTFHRVGVRAAKALHRYYFDAELNVMDVYERGHCYLNFFNDMKLQRLLLCDELPRFLTHDVYKRSVFQGLVDSDFKDRVAVKVSSGRLHVMHVETADCGYVIAPAWVVWNALPNLFKLRCVDVEWDNNLKNFIRIDLSSEEKVVYNPRVTNSGVDLMQLAGVSMVKLKIPKGDPVMAHAIVAETTVIGTKPLFPCDVAAVDFMKMIVCARDVLAEVRLPYNSYEKISERVPAVCNAVKGDKLLVEEHWRTINTQLQRLLQTVSNHVEARKRFREMVKVNKCGDMLRWK